VLRREPGAELEQRLSVALHELVKDRSPCGIGQCLEDVSHDPTIGKQRLACQRSTVAGGNGGLTGAVGDRFVPLPD
jgi:hypothetical protein